MLSKMVRSELAEANGVAEEVLSSMSTVKAHAAQVGIMARSTAVDILPKCLSISWFLILLEME